MLAHGLLSCVSAVFVVCSSGLWGGVGGGGGGGGVDNVQFAYIARYSLRIPRYLQALARFKLESSGVRRGRNFMWFPLRPSTQQ